MKSGNPLAYDPKWSCNPRRRDRLNFSPFAHVELVTYDPNGPSTTILYENKINPYGKTLRLINPFPLCNADFLRAISLSQLVVGCTGDLSFSEVLSQDKIPFYEVLLHKRPFWNGFIQLAEQHKKKSLAKFAKQLLTISGEGHHSVEIQLTQNPCLAKEMQELIEIIREKHNIEKTIRALVGRAVLFKQHPQLRELEQTLKTAWAEGEISAEEVLERLRQVCA